MVSGAVQGVWFRDSCRREAAARGVSGRVANRLDGTVEAVFEGPEPAVAEMVSWCRAGPPRADVSGIDVVQESPERVVGFRVR